MESKDIKWCPQHGYLLPCHKCGMPLSQASQSEIFQAGKQAGIKEVVEWVNSREEIGYLSQCGFNHVWQSKLKEWAPNKEHFELPDPLDVAEEG